MRILLEANVALDVLLDRSPHANSSAAVWAAAESGQATGLLAAHAVTTIYYLLRRQLSAEAARRSIAALMQVFEVAAVDARVLREAMRAKCPDFEDAVTAAAAHAARCDFVVTRDLKGFQGSPVPAVTPAALIPLI